MDKSVGLKDALKSFYPLLILIAAIELLIWAHWNSLIDTASLWDNPKYSHAYLVPLFAGVLLFLRRDESVPLIKSLATLGGSLLGVGLLLCVLPFVLPDSVVTLPARTTELIEAIGVALSVAGGLLVIQQRLPFMQVSVAERWIGLGLLMASEMVRLWATHTSHYWPERFSFIPALAGLFVMVGGLHCLRWAGWPAFFLIFMLPLPKELDGTLSASLQTQATASSTYALQTLGVGAVRSGNVISVGHNGMPMEVEEACSGLRMLTIFGALCFAVVLLGDFPLWQRIVIVLSSVPIALAVNIIRITGTGILFSILPTSQEKLRVFFHDGAGLVMMPLAMLLLFLEYKVLSNLFVEDDDELANVGVAAARKTAPAAVALAAAAPAAGGMTAAVQPRAGNLSGSAASARPAPRAAPRPAATVPSPVRPASSVPSPVRPAAGRPSPTASGSPAPLPSRPRPGSAPIAQRPVPVANGAKPAAATQAAGAAMPTRPAPAQTNQARPIPARPVAPSAVPTQPPAAEPVSSGGNSPSNG